VAGTASGRWGRRSARSRGGRSGAGVAGAARGRWERLGLRRL